MRWFVESVLSSAKGSVAVQIGVGLGALVGMLGLGTESTFLIYKHRQMQSVADSAALSGVMALAQAAPRDPVSEGRAVAARLGYVHGADQVTVTVNTPPTSGTYAGNANAVEVTVSQPQDLAIMAMFGTDNVNVGTRSVALRNSTGRFCVLALDNSAAQSVYMSNNAELPDEDCGVAANSTSSTAVYMRNNAVIEGPVNTRGETDLANNAEINGALTEHGPKIDDPYADVELQAAPSCTSQDSSGKNNKTFNFDPGRWCNGWDFMNNVTLNLRPGVYYIDSKLSIKNNVVVNAVAHNGQEPAVTLVINGNYAIDIGNNATLNIKAPTSGNYAGIAFFGKRDATSSVLQKFSNNTVLNITGAVYFPNQILEFDNNGTTAAEGCTHVIGRMVRFMNNATLKNDCEGTGVEPISAAAQLVE